MKYADNFAHIRAHNLISPEDLNKSWPELLAKAKELEQLEAPKMLISSTLALSLEIEMRRHNSLAIELEPATLTLTLPLVAVERKQEREIEKIKQLLQKAGWTIRPTNQRDIIELSVAKTKPVKSNRH